jgi:hypothetical protein
VQLAQKDQLRLIFIVDLEIQADLYLEIFQIVLDLVSHKPYILHVVLQENGVRLPLLEEEAMHPTNCQVGILSRIEDVLEAVLRKTLGLDGQAVVDTLEDVLLGGGFILQIYATSVRDLSSHFLEIGWNYLAGTSLVGSQAQSNGSTGHLRYQGGRTRQLSVQPLILLQFLQGRPLARISTEH